MSDILIKGMEMPTNCGDCKAFVCYRQWAGDIGDCFCGITKEDAKAKEKNADCPLFPVPPHGRLIDAEWLKQLYDDPAYGEDVSRYHVAIPVILANIDDAPTIIEAEEGET